VGVNDSTPSEPTPKDGEPIPEDGEPTSFVETAKNWVKKHKILVAVGVVGAVGLAVVGVVIKNAVEQNVFEDTEDAEGAEDAEDSEPVSDTETTGEPRQSPRPHLRNLAEGWNASEAKKAQYKEKTGDDLAPGTTWVDPLEDEDPGEAAA
jgi:cytoskeletal protein RodZ